MATPDGILFCVPFTPSGLDPSTYTGLAIFDPLGALVQVGVVKLSSNAYYTYIVPACPLPGLVKAFGIAGDGQAHFATIAWLTHVSDPLDSVSIPEPDPTAYWSDQGISSFMWHAHPGGAVLRSDNFALIALDDGSVANLTFSSVMSPTAKPNYIAAQTGNVVVSNTNISPVASTGEVPVATGTVTVSSHSEINPYVYTDNQTGFTPLIKFGFSSDENVETAMGVAATFPPRTMLDIAWVDGEYAFKSMPQGATIQLRLWDDPDPDGMGLTCTATTYAVWPSDPATLLTGAGVHSDGVIFGNQFTLVGGTIPTPRTTLQYFWQDAVKADELPVVIQL